MGCMDRESPPVAAALHECRSRAASDRGPPGRLLLVQGERGDSAGRALAPSPMEASPARCTPPPRRRWPRRRPSPARTRRPGRARRSFAITARNTSRIGAASHAGLDPLGRVGAGHVRERAFSDVCSGPAAASTPLEHGRDPQRGAQSWPAAARRRGPLPPARDRPTAQALRRCELANLASVRGAWRSPRFCRCQRVVDFECVARFVRRRSGVGTNSHDLHAGGAPASGT